MPVTGSPDGVRTANRTLTDVADTAAGSVGDTISTTGGNCWARLAWAVRPAAARLVSFGPMEFDTELGELRHKGKRVQLTEAETALLRAFVSRIGDVLSRETLCRSIGAAVNERAIDVQVTRLRRKIEPDPTFPRYLRTVRGQGYRLVDA